MLSVKAGCKEEVHRQIFVIENFNISDEKAENCDCPRFYLDNEGEFLPLLIQDEPYFIFHCLQYGLEDKEQTLEANI